MAKNKVVTSSMAIALTLSSVSTGFAEEQKLNVGDTPPKVEVKTEDGKEGDSAKPGEEPKEEGEEKPTVTPPDGEKPEVEKPEEGKPDGEKPEVEKPDGEEVKPPPSEGDDSDSDEYYNDSNVSIKGGFYVYVKHMYGNTSEDFKHIIPTMTFELLDESGKSLGTAVASEGNYKKGSGYTLHFKNVPEFKKGDKFRLRLKSADAVVEHIIMQYTDEFTEEVNEYGELNYDLKDINLGKGKEVLFDVTAETGYTMKDGKEVITVLGSKDAPLSVTMK